MLDIDIGPLLQTRKLLTSVLFARAKGYTKPLSAAELEMMNLTGDGTGLDMVTMPQAMRERVPTANFFQRGGYERNPVAIRHNTVAKLLAVTDARMDGNSNLPGAKELAAAFYEALTLPSFSPCGRRWCGRSPRRMRGLYRRRQPFTRPRCCASCPRLSQREEGRGPRQFDPKLNLPSPSR